MFKALLKKQLLSTLLTLFGGRSKKLSQKSLVGFGFIILFMLAYLGFFNYISLTPLCIPLHTLNLDWIFFAYSIIYAIVFTLITGVFTVQSTVYDSNDNDMMLAMPIPPRYLLISRLLPIYLQCFLFSSVPLAVSFVYYAVNINISLTLVASWAAMLIVVPLFAFILCTLLGTVTAWICSKTAHKNAVSIFVSLLFFAAYSYCLSSAQDLLSDTLLLGEALGDKIRAFLWPIYQMGLACIGKLLPLITVLLGTTVISLVIYLIISRNYIKIITAKKAVKKPRYRSKEMKSASPSNALLRKECSRFFGNATYLLNAGLGSVFMVFISVFLYTLLFEMLGSGIERSYDYGSVISCLAIIVLCTVASMNTVSAPSIALEGKTLWILQSIPVEPWIIIKSKLMFHILVTAPFTLICTIPVAIMFAPDALVGIIVAVTPILFVVFTGCLGLICGLKKPNFDWENITVAVKQNAAGVITLFGSWAVLALFIVLYVTGIAEYIPIVLYPYIPFCVFTLADMFMLMWLKDKGTKIFAEL